MLSADVVTALKKIPNGKKGRKLLRMRMLQQLEDPEGDPLTKRLLPPIEFCRAGLKGRILDVGCYTGFLYHYLGKPEGYTGIDIWPEAIEIAKEFAPEADFRLEDGFKVEGYWDVLWCSQIVWGQRRVVEAIEKMKHLASRYYFIVVDKDLEGTDLPFTKVGGGLSIIHG